MTDASYMNRVAFDSNREKLTDYLMTYEKNFHNSVQKIKKIYLLDNYEVVKNFQDYHEDNPVIDCNKVFEIEEDYDSDDIRNLAPTSEDNEYEEEIEKWLDEDELRCDVYVMVRNGDNFHSMREIGKKDKNGNSNFPAWLPENHFTPNTCIPIWRQVNLLKYQYYESVKEDDSFFVFVIFEEESEEDKPVTEASRIILQEFLDNGKDVNHSCYSNPDKLQTWFHKYAKDNAEKYDEKWFALIVIPAVEKTINWSWISKELIKKDEEDEDEEEGKCSCGNCEYCFSFLESD
jgi:hypothetical protein